MAKKSKEEQVNEEMHEEETIHVEEEETTHKADADGNWTDEFVVAGNELMDMVNKLVREVGVRRMVIRNEKHNINFEVPLVMGVAGMFLMPPVAVMLSVVTALVTETSILVERATPTKEAEADTAVA